MNRAKIRVAVGLSGGVDSATSALLLKEAGYEVVGVHLYCWPPKEEYLVASSQYSVEEKESLRKEWMKKNGCRADEDKQAALKTALELSIPFVTLDFSEEYNCRVVDYFYREYEAGRTPNPDVLCNSEIKFGLFLDWALKNGFEYIATGHYARVITSPLTHRSSGSPSPEYRRGERGLSLEIPKDIKKDQTYFLWKLTQKELAHVLFPLEDLEKSEVRKIALEAELSVATRPDSQGICFVGNVEARKFLARRLKVKKGEVKNIFGEVIGTHDGVWFYTIGQRGGWDIFPAVQRKIAVTPAYNALRSNAGRQGHSDTRTPVFYVISKDAKKNELVVGVGEETKRQSFEVDEVNWMVPNVIRDSALLCFVRIRHGGKLIKSKVERLKDKVVVEMGEAQRGVAPGQSAVFYSEDGEVLGGGVIA